MDRVICHEVKAGRWSLFETAELMELKRALQNTEDDGLIVDKVVFKELYSDIAEQIKKRRKK